MSTLCENGPAGAVVPVLPHLEMLEQQPRASVAFPAQSAVDEILIDRHENEAARREQLAEVAIAGIGVVEQIVIAVHDQDEREGPSPSGYQTRPLIGDLLTPKPQSFSRALTCGGSTVRTATRPPSSS